MEKKKVAVIHANIPASFIETNTSSDEPHLVSAEDVAIFIKTGKMPSHSRSEKVYTFYSFEDIY